MIHPARCGCVSLPRSRRRCGGWPRWWPAGRGRPRCSPPSPMSSAALIGAEATYVTRVDHLSGEREGLEGHLTVVGSYGRVSDQVPVGFRVKLQPGMIHTAALQMGRPARAGRAEGPDRGAGWQVLRAQPGGRRHDGVLRASGLGRRRAAGCRPCQQAASAARDRAGNWDGWYREAIPLADERFTQHLTELVAEESRKPGAAATPSGVTSRPKAARLTRGPAKSRPRARPQPANAGKHTCAPMRKGRRFEPYRQHQHPRPGRMTGGFDPGRYTTAPLQTEGVIRFSGSPDAARRQAAADSTWRRPAASSGMGEAERHCCW